MTRAGMAFQGDVSIIPVPADGGIDRSDEIKPVDGRLILQEGEVTGHHHAIAFADRPATRQLLSTALLSRLSDSCARP